MNNQPYYNVIRVETFYNGKNKFTVTYDFGYKLIVQSDIKPYKGNDGFYYIQYDMKKAGLLINSHNFLFLCIKA